MTLSSHGQIYLPYRKSIRTIIDLTEQGKLGRLTTAGGRAVRRHLFEFEFEFEIESRSSLNSPSASISDTRHYAPSIETRPFDTPMTRYQFVSPLETTIPQNPPILIHFPQPHWHVVSLHE